MSFQKSDYIVILRDGSKSEGFRRNSIYKQSIEAWTLFVEIDSNGVKNNGWEKLLYDNIDHWRYADKYEIQEYEENKGPCRVSNSFDLLMKKLNHIENKLK